MFVLHQADGFHAARHHNGKVITNNLFGGGSDRHQAGRTQTVHGHARHGHGQPRRRYTLTPHIIALGALLGGHPHNHIFNLVRRDIGPPDGFAHHMAA